MLIDWIATPSSAASCACIAVTKFDEDDSAVASTGIAIETLLGVGLGVVVLS